MTFFYILLAALGLGLLIFIHELGHYWVARWVGIKVEAFSIGFGRAIVSWTNKAGVEWRIGWIPVGGYVRMAGTDKKGDVPPHEVPGGYFAARPIDRIKVAVAGPLVNFVFAFVVFTLIWSIGGRDKPFSEFTSRIGWVDPVSELYQAGLRPGDIIESYDDHPVKSARDHLQASLLGGDQIEVKGFFVDYPKRTKTPFELAARSYRHPYTAEELSTLGVLFPAQYLINRKAAGDGSPFPAGSPMVESGAEPGDRLFWADGYLLFSTEQLSHIVAAGQAMVTVERDGLRQLHRVPRVPLHELAFRQSEADNLSDWHYALSLAGRVGDVISIPYAISPSGQIQRAVDAIDPDMQHKLFPTNGRSLYSEPLQVGDKIVAIDGHPVQSGLQALERLQSHQILFIMQRNPKGWPIVPWREADLTFDQSINWNSLAALTRSIGSESGVRQVGEFVLLNPVAPVTYLELEQAAGRAQEFEEAVAKQRQKIEKLVNPEQRKRMLLELEAAGSQLRVGIELHDRVVQYNPPPTTQFFNAVGDTWRTWKALVSGYLNPKWISGPVGIVQVMHYGWLVGIREALYWLAIISLNLGILNLLPIPVLDGGQIVFAAWELVTRRRIKIETMEKMVIPFVILFIGLFIFLTYQDLSRLFRGFF